MTPVCCRCGLLTNAIIWTRDWVRIAVPACLQAGIFSPGRFQKKRTYRVLRTAAFRAVVLSKMLVYDPRWLEGIAAVRKIFPS